MHRNQVLVICCRSLEKILSFLTFNSFANVSHCCLLLWHLYTRLCLIFLPMLLDLRSLRHHSWLPRWRMLINIFQINCGGKASRILIWHVLDALDIRQTWIVRIFNEFLSMKYFCFLFIHQLMTCRKCFSMNEFEIVPNLCFIALKNGELFLHLLLPLSGVWPRFWITNSFVDKVSFNQFMPTKRAAEVKLARKQTGFF